MQKIVIFIFIFTLSATNSFTQKPSDWEGLWEGTYQVTQNDGSNIKYQMNGSFRHGNFILRGVGEERPRMIKGLDFKVDPSYRTTSSAFKESTRENDTIAGKLIFWFDGNNFRKIFGKFEPTKKNSIQVEIILNRVVGDHMLETRLPDLKKVVVIEATEIDDFQEGFAIIRKGDQFAMIQYTGEIALPWGTYKFNERNGYKIDNSLCGFINGMCVVRDVETEKYGFINSEGKLVVPCTLSDIDPFGTDGFGWGKEIKTNGEEQFYFFDKKGKRYPTKINSFDLTSRTINQNEPIYWVKNGSYYEFFHKTGRLVFRTKRIVSGPFSNGLIRVDTTYELAGTKTGFIDTLNRLIIPYKAGNYDNFYNGFALITGSGADEFMYAFMNKKGEYLIKLRQTDEIKSASRPSRFIPSVYGDPEAGFHSWLKVNNKDAYISNNGELFLNALEEKNKGSAFEGIRFALPLEIYKSHQILTQFPFEARRHYDEPNDFKTGGVGGGRVLQRAQTRSISGIGMINYYGEAVFWPVYDKIGLTDRLTGLTKATITDRRTNKTFDGYLDTKGIFVIIKKPEN